MVDIPFEPSFGEDATASRVKSYSKEQISDLISDVFEETNSHDRMRWVGLVAAGNVSRKKQARAIRRWLQGCPVVPSLSTVEKWLSGDTKGAGEYELRVYMNARAQFATEIEMAASLGQFCDVDLVGGIE